MKKSSANALNSWSRCSRSGGGVARTRQQITRGKPLGSFETWAEWCRDPLLTLGCRDPVERIEALKANDPRRQRIAELFQVWWEHHGQSQ